MFGTPISIFSMDRCYGQKVNHMSELTTQIIINHDQDRKVYKIDHIMSKRDYSRDVSQGPG